MRALDATDASITAGALAVSALVTVEPQKSPDSAVRLMAACDTAHVIVVENHYPVGIVSALNVARAAGGA